MSRFIDPKTDFGFKYIFGREESKPFLIDFLNNLLKDEPGFDTIVSLEYLDKEKSKGRKDERGVIYDIHCHTSNGRQFTVEMQNNEQDYYIDRMIYYASKAIVDQGKSGADWRYGYEPVYVISFMNFVSDRFGGAFRTDAALCNLSTHQPISDKQRYIFIQLPLFDKKTPEECITDIDQWYYVLINMSTMDTMPFTQQKNLFDRLSSVASYASLSREDRIAYDADLKAYRDMMGQLSFAEARGLKQGLEQGEEKKTAEIVRRMALDGLSIDTIAKYAGVAVDKIKHILGK